MGRTGEHICPIKSTEALLLVVQKIELVIIAGAGARRLGVYNGVHGGSGFERVTYRVTLSTQPPVKKEAQVNYLRLFFSEL